ncbi:hypothetical protein ACFONN_10455 [Dyella humi]|uniref:DNA-binding protein n=1 Tax=Dyella humi TaxID=1770547 RepID=A0ABW8IJN7_9GAMM
MLARVCLKSTNPKAKVDAPMPKSLPRAFSDQFLRSNGILDLDPETLLQPEEAAVLLGITTTSLERRRKAGDPPPFRQTKPRAAVRYALGDVLATRRLHRHTSIAEVAKAHDDNLVSHLTFNHFLPAAAADEEWPFVSTGHVDRPVDLFFALTLPINKRKGLRWLTLMEYLVALQGALEAEPRAELAEERQNTAIPYGADLPSNDRVRSRT